MESRGAPVKELFYELRNCSAGGPVLGQLGNLLRSGNLSGQQEPEETLRQWFTAARSLRKEFLALRNCLATEAYPLILNDVSKGREREMVTNQHQEQNHPR